jgi:hypothetical protein
MISFQPTRTLECGALSGVRRSVFGKARRTQKSGTQSAVCRGIARRWQSAKVSPNFNRDMNFGTTDFTYHGHPDPLACPEGVTRKSLAL